MKTERTLELLKYFREHGISHAPDNGLTLTLEYQDCIGRSTEQEIYDFYQSLNQDQRQLFTWANMNTLSYDMAVSIIKRTVIANYKTAIVRDWEKFIQEQTKRVSDKENALRESKRAIYRHIREAREENEELRSRLERVNSQLNHLNKLHWETCQIAKEYRDQAEKYQAIKAALKITD